MDNNHRIRILKFIVDGQIIRKDPSCDFSNLVSGTEGYLQAEFSFSKEWAGCAKVVEFKSMGNECPPGILKDGKTLMIPAEALESYRFSVKIYGKRKEFRLTTNSIVVDQIGG